MRNLRIDKTIIMILQETYTLNNGIDIPKLALGTWFISDQEVTQAVIDAVRIGYRHIDTAQAYQNEEGVGAGIRNCGVDRTELFVTTKLAAEIKSYEEALAAIDASLAALGLDYIDLMLIHSPKPWLEYQEAEPFFAGNREAWRALETAYQAGKLRAIGLSNFQEADIDNILSSCTVKPMVNQILVHIGNTPTALIDYSQQQGILVAAYSPIGHGALLQHPTVGAMAQKYGVSAPQLAIRYDLQLGLLPVPKTANPEHMQTNAAVDFVISEADLEQLKQLSPITDYGEANKFPVFGGDLKKW